MNPLVVVVLLIAVALILTILTKKKKKILPPPALSQREYAPFQLIEKRDLTSTLHKTTFFRFALPAGHRLGLPVGNHISLRITKPDDGKMFTKPYTPVSSDDDIGYFDLVIKVYAEEKKGEKVFPRGVMGSYMNEMKVGDMMDVKGPMGEVVYNGNGRFAITRKDPEKKVATFVQQALIRRVGMIAGGTGITPMLAIIRDIMKRPHDKTHVSLIFGNLTVDDILLREELEAIAKLHPTRFNLHLILDKPPSGWTGSGGFVTPELISRQLPAPTEVGDSLILLCGPPGMIKAMNGHLTGLKYRPEETFSF
jgi:cytochrome-b5 reductase